MEKFNINGQEILLVDGKIYSEIKPIIIGSSTATHKQVSKPQNSNRGLQQRIRGHRERKARRHLGPEAEEVIREEIRNGLGLTEACKKYEISVSTFYRLKGDAINGPVKEI